MKSVIAVVPHATAAYMQFNVAVSSCQSNLVCNAALQLTKSLYSHVSMCIGVIPDVSEEFAVEARTVPPQVQHARGVGPQRPHPAPAQGHHH